MKARSSAMRNLIILIGLILLALGALRSIALVSHYPVLAHANNWDESRVAGCVGVKPNDATLFKHPFASLLPSNAFSERCLPSTQSVTVKLLLSTAGRPSKKPFDIRIIGLFYVVAMLLMATLMFLIYLRSMGEVCLLIPLVYCLVLCDPSITYYFNTLYAETPAFILAPALFFLSLYIPFNPSRRGIAVAVFLAIPLSFAKHMFAPIAASLLLILGLFLFTLRTDRWRQYLITLVLASTVLFAASSFFYTTAENGSNEISAANRIDSIFGAIIPSSGSPTKALHDLGLPKRCQSLIGKNWYTKGVTVAFRSQCPEVTTVNPARIVTFLIWHPSTLFRLFNQEIVRSSDWYLSYLGKVSDLHVAASAKLPSKMHTPYELFRLVIVHKALYLWTTWALIAAGLLSVGHMLLTRPNLASQSSRLVRFIEMTLASGGGVIFVTLFTALVGDGFFEVSKHCAMLQFIFPVTLIMMMYGFLMVGLRTWLPQSFSIDKRALEGATS